MQVPVQVSSSQHSVSPGVQAGADAHEHAPQAQLPEQVCVPYVLQASVAFGAQTPSPVHVPATHVPDPLQVSVSVPQSPHAAGVVWPGAQTPTQAPLAQV
jgi:hypothetical protein